MHSESKHAKLLIGVIYLVLVPSLYLRPYFVLIAEARLSMRWSLCDYSKTCVKRPLKKRQNKNLLMTTGIA